MSLWSGTILFYSFLQIVTALMYTEGGSGLITYYMDTFDPNCLTSGEDNLTIPGGDVNIIAFVSGEGESNEKCIDNVLHFVINIEYAIEEAVRHHPSRSNASIVIDYAIIHSCWCNDSSLRTDDIVTLLHETQNPVVILAANFPPHFTHALFEITDNLYIPVYSLSSHYVTELRNQQNPIFNLTPSHEALVEAIVEVIDHFEWSWVSFLSTDDEIGRTFMRVAETRLERYDHICLDMKILIKLNGDLASEERLRIQTKIQNSSSKVLVAFVEDLNCMSILDEIRHIFPDHVWILASLESGHHNETPENHNWTLHVSPTSYSLPVNINDFLIEWCSKRPNCSSPGGHGGDHQWSRHTDTICQTTENGTVSREVERIDVYMAVRMIENFATCTSFVDPQSNSSSCSSRPMFDHLVARELLPFTNGTNAINVFGGVNEKDGMMSVSPWGFDIRAGLASSIGIGSDNDGGSMLIGRFMANSLSSDKIVMDDDHVIWPMGRGKVPESRCSASCPSSHKRFSLPGQPVCCFVCLYCEGSINYTYDGSMRCEQCPSRHWFNITSGSCEPRYLDYLRWDSIPSLVIIVISAISILVNVILLAVIAYHHASPIVKAANRELSLLLLLATIVSLVAPILHIGLPTKEHCMIHVGLQGPMISLVVSVYLVKTKGVLSIFEAKLPDLMHRHLFLQRHLQLLAVLVIVLIEGVTVMVYLILVPPGVLYMDSHIPHITYVECDYGLLALPVQWFYNWIIVVVAFVLAFRARHLPENFGEARMIASCMGCSLLAWLLSFTCFVLSNGSLKAIFQSIILVICPWFFMGFLYFPKCYIILRQPHRNTVQELRRMTMAHVQRKADQVCESSASRRASSSPDVLKDKSSKTHFKDKQTSMKTSSIKRGSDSKDGRIVLQIDALEVSGQGTDETGISSSGSVSSFSDGSSRNSVERGRSAISLLNHTAMAPTVELLNNSHVNRCATSHLGNTNNSNSHHTDSSKVDETPCRETGDITNSETLSRHDSNASSVLHRTSDSGDPIEDQSISTPCKAPVGGKADVSVTIMSSSPPGCNDKSNTVYKDESMSNCEGCDEEM